MYFHPKDEYIYYLGNSDIKQRLTDRSASHFGRFAPQTRPMGCAICSKPSYYALLFFKQLHSILVKRGNHFIVTKDGLEHYVIILFNNKSLNYEYYSKDENTITPTDVERIFNDHDSLEISLTLQGVSNRKYHIRRQIYGPECGSILDEWNRLGTDSPLTLSEISYLRQQSVPHRKNNTVIVENHTLPLQEVLHEHEIMLIQID